MKAEKGIEIQPFDPNGNTKREKLRQNLEALDKEYREYEASQEVVLPETLGLVEKEKNSTTNEEITAQVTDKHAPEKENEMAKISASADSEIADVEDKKQAELIDEENDLDTISAGYAEARTNAEDGAIRRGLAHSSIYEGERRELELGEEGDLEARRAEAQANLSALDLEIELLNEKLERDLESYEIAHAAKVGKEIEKLISERDKENEAIEEYNNRIREKEAKYQEERFTKAQKAAKEREEQLRYEEEHGYTGYKKANYLERYRLAREYYKTMPRDKAIEALRGDTFVQNYLGYYYGELMRELAYDKEN